MTLPYVCLRLTHVRHRRNSFKQSEWTSRSFGFRIKTPTYHKIESSEYFGAFLKIKYRIYTNENNALSCSSKYCHIFTLK